MLSGLTLLFQLDFLEIQWVGALVIGLFFVRFGYILVKKFDQIRSIDSSLGENSVDFSKIEWAN